MAAAGRHPCLKHEVFRCWREGGIGERIPYPRTACGSFQGVVRP